MRDLVDGLANPERERIAKRRRGDPQRTSGATTRSGRRAVVALVFDLGVDAVGVRSDSAVS